MSSKNSYFSKEKSKLIKDMLYDDDYVKYEKDRQKKIKRQEWLYEYSGVIYLHAIFWSCIIWSIVSH